MSSLIARGLSGELRFGYHQVASLGPWEILTRDGLGNWALFSSLEDPNPFWLTEEREFKLRLSVGRFQWQWDKVQIQLMGNQKVSMILQGTPQIL